MVNDLELKLSALRKLYREKLISPELYKLYVLEVIGAENNGK